MPVIKSPKTAAQKLLAKAKAGKDFSPIPQEVAQASGATQPPKKDMKVGPSAKPPTFAAQVKALNPAGKAQPITVPFNQRDIDIASYMAAIKQELKKKYKHTWSEKYKSSMKTVLAHAAKAPDALVYLQKVLKILNPKATLYTGSPGQKIKPGEFQNLPTPNIPLSTAAQQFAPTPENKAKADALAEKIKAYEAEIVRLKLAQQQAEKNKNKADNEASKLAGVNEKLLKYFSYIEHHCSEFLETVNATNKFLYRGQDDATSPVFVGYPRADREPKDSDPAAQKMADEFLSLMGFKALRSNSIFTSASKDHASNYGDVYAIFPKNGFKFTWSTKHDDLVIDSVNALVGHEREDSDDVYYEYSDYFDDLDWLEYDGELQDYLEEESKYEYGSPACTKDANAQMKLIKADPDFKSIRKAIDKWGDIDTYEDEPEKIHQTFLNFATLIIPFTKKFKVLPKFDKSIEKDMAKAKKALDNNNSNKGDAAKKALAAKVIKDYGFKQDDLASAMKAKHEICILGEYVAVDFGRYEEDLKKYFLSKKNPKNPKLGPKKAPSTNLDSDDFDDSEDY